MPVCAVACAQLLARHGKRRLGETGRMWPNALGEPGSPDDVFGENLEQAGLLQQKKTGGHGRQRCPARQFSQDAPLCPAPGAVLGNSVTWEIIPNLILPGELFPMMLTHGLPHPVVGPRKAMDLCASLPSRNPGRTPGSHVRANGSILGVWNGSHAAIPERGPGGAHPPLPPNQAPATLGEPWEPLGRPWKNLGNPIGKTLETIGRPWKTLETLGSHWEHWNTLETLGKTLGNPWKSLGIDRLLISG
eukprot:gene17570-biopygen8956